jgi:hypothetical protein
VADALKARERFSTPALRQLLNETGFGNHPEVIKFFAKVGKAMREDAFHPPGSPPAPPEQPLENKFYPTTSPK